MPAPPDITDDPRYREIMDRRSEIEAPCNPSQYRVLKRIASNPQNFFTVGFGGGSMPGVAANCALSDLVEELELRPHVREVWGTSAGSIVGGGLCCGTSGHEVLELAQVLGIKGSIDIPKWELFVKGTIRFLRSRELPDGLIRGDHFRNVIAAGLSITNIEECEIPFFVITCTDDGHARKIILDKGNLLDAIAASMCIPGVMFPVRAGSDDHGYLDGGVVEKTPLLSIIERHTRLQRSEELVVLCSHFNNRGKVQAPRGFLERFLYTIEHLEEAVWEHQLTKAREAANCKFLVLNPRTELGGMFDFALLGFWYLWARNAFKEQLSNASIAARFTAR